MIQDSNPVLNFRLDYTVYGYLAISSAEAALGFNGQRLDRKIRGYWLGNGHRLYAPSLMRFISPDRLSPFGVGGLNRYAFCEGDPINWLDPTGKSRWPGRAVPVVKVRPYRPATIATVQRNGLGKYNGSYQRISVSSSTRSDIPVSGNSPSKDVSHLPTLKVAPTRSDGPTINQLADSRATELYWQHRPGAQPFSLQDMIPNHQRAQGEIATIEIRQMEVRNIQLLSTVGHDPI